MNNDMYKLLFEAVQEGSVEAVRKAASSVFGSAVSVTDTAFRVLSADIDPGSTDNMLEKKGDQVYVSGELLDLFRKHDLLRSLNERPHETIVVDWDYFAEHPHLTTGIFWENNILGSITVLVDSCNYTKEQDEALQACADALALVLHNSKYGKKELRTERDRFTSKLFRGLAAERDLENAENNEYFRRSRRYTVLATDYIPDSVFEKTAEENYRILLYQREGITYLLADASGQALQTLQNWIADRGARYGMSYSFSDPLLASRMAKQARAALDFGNHSGINEAEWKFPEHALKMAVQQIPDVSDYIHPGILEMAEYDRENNTEYLETMKQWLLNKMDYSATAKAMNLHRNSLYYRMERIYELFDLEFTDMNTDVQLYLSLFTDVLNND